jgi:hypothetical protein
VHRYTLVIGDTKTALDHLRTRLASYAGRKETRGQNNQLTGSLILGLDCSITAVLTGHSAAKSLAAAEVRGSPPAEHRHSWRNRQKVYLAAWDRGANRASKSLVAPVVEIEAMSRAAGTTIDLAIIISIPRGFLHD